MRRPQALPEAHKPATAKLYDTAKREATLLPDKEMQDQFAQLMHSIILAFSRIKTEALMQQEAVIAEWHDFRGLLAPTEERLELLEIRMERAERQIQSLADAAGVDVGQPPREAIEKLKAIMANYLVLQDKVRGRPPQGDRPGEGPDRSRLARETGLSIGTVRNYFTRPHLVREVTRARIAETIERMKEKAEDAAELEESARGTA